MCDETLVASSLRCSSIFPIAACSKVVHASGSTSAARDLCVADQQQGLWHRAAVRQISGASETAHRHGPDAMTFEAQFDSDKYVALLAKLINEVGKQCSARR